MDAQTTAANYERLLAFEFPELIERYEEKFNLSHQDAVALFVSVKQFLFICGYLHDGGPWSPPKEIDEGWHEFILHTRRYNEFCIGMFGSFIHHNPYSSSTPQEERGTVENTRFMARKLFGRNALNEKHWGLALTTGCAACGGPCNDCGD